jgi:GntR family transcriptional repressor for pyruvate dehydrogenase complex
VIGEDRGSALVVSNVAQRRLPDIIAEQIVAGIEKAGLRPGDRLPTEHELSKQLGVGRTSVREGLQKLQTLGVVDVQKGRGAFVAHPRPDSPTLDFTRWVHQSGFSLEELLEVRMALEAAAAGLASSRITAEELVRLQACHDEHVRAAEEGHLEASILSATRFHEILITASRNDMIVRLYSGLAPEIAEARRHSLALPGAARRSARGQRPIIDALRAHDPLAARRATLDHLWLLYDEAKALGGSKDDGIPPLIRDALG